MSQILNFELKDNLEKIPILTSIVSRLDNKQFRISVDSIMRRIPDQPDLVSVKLELVSRSKITMPEFSTNFLFHYL